MSLNRDSIASANELRKDLRHLMRRTRRTKISSQKISVQPSCQDAKKTVKRENGFYLFGHFGPKFEKVYCRIPNSSGSRG